MPLLDSRSLSVAARWASLALYEKRSLGQRFSSPHPLHTCGNRSVARHENSLNDPHAASQRTSEQLRQRDEHQLPQRPRTSQPSNLSQVTILNLDFATLPSGVLFLLISLETEVGSAMTSRAMSTSLSRASSMSWIFFLSP